MRKRVGTVCAVTGLVAVVLLTWAAAAGADVVKPPAACVGSATWTKTKQHETTTAHATGDVVKIPQSGDVQWAANQSGYTLDMVGPRRQIDGKIQLKLPFGQTLTIDSWKGSSERFANTDTKHYHLPDVLIGAKLRMTGYMKENGKVVCSGAVSLRVGGKSGDNPVVIAAFGGAVIFGALMVFAGKPVSPR
jgi:hypothetical protein